MKERESQYLDLKHGLQATNMITPDTPKENKFFQMWLLEKHCLMCDVNTQVTMFSSTHSVLLHTRIVLLFYV